MMTIEFFGTPACPRQITPTRGHLLDREWGVMTGWGLQCGPNA